ncbi:TATA element modulatory factor isoform X2 [Patella vulgata]|uniref:TATA element modulatory factor isoform X2 n=1 Tax=Patella vulgata TaxID=6465 RepID=UPI0024A7ABEF|nr:TATA element modulatory factor isoform X2 [Patella vulgata]
MSWWKASGWTDLASQAIKNAQQKIDKVLDIDEGGQPAKPKVESPSTSTPKSEEPSSEFWNSWLPAASDATDKQKAGVAPSPKSGDLQPISKDESSKIKTKKSASERDKQLPLSRKSSDERIKPQSKSSSPRTNIQKVTTPPKKEDSSFGGWGFSWGGVEDDGNSSISSWGSVSSKGNGKEDTNTATEAVSVLQREKELVMKSEKDLAMKSEIDLAHTCDKGLGQKSKNESAQKSDKELMKKSEIESELSSAKEPVQKNDCELFPLTDPESEQKFEKDVVQDESVNKPTVVFNKFDDNLASENTLTVSDDQDLSVTDKEINRTDISDSLFTDIKVEESDVSESKDLSEDSNIESVTEQSMTIVDSDKTIEISAESEMNQLEKSYCSSTNSIEVCSATESNSYNSSPIDHLLKEDNPLTEPSSTSDMDSVVETTDPLSASDTTILTLSGTDYQQTSLIEEDDSPLLQEHIPIDPSDGIHQEVPVDAGTEKLSKNDSITDIHCDINTSDSVLDDTEQNVNMDVQNCESLCDSSKLDSSVETGTSGDTIVDPQDIGETSEGVNNQGMLEQSYESLGGSFVKCMIEEAMEDTSRPDDSGSDGHSNGEKSESSKFESENDKSGHESSDEIETTTSSDIEIISAPTPNGEYKLFDLSPLRIALQKTVQRGSTSHRRSDSQSSSSTYSKAGESDQMSPGRDSLERQDIDSGDDYDTEHHRRPSQDELRHRAPELSVVSEESGSNPYQTEKLLKKLAEMAEVLQARENKLVHLSKENNDLLETNSILRNQLQQSEEAHEAKMVDVDTLTEEFKRRITEGEKKLTSVIKERDNIKKQLSTVQDELNKKISDRSHLKLIEEKDEQINELLLEGEKLSKQQLQSNNIIKKLRSKEKENDILITSQKSKIDDMTKELDHLRKVCDVKDDLEKKQTDAINQLNAAVQKQEKELLKYRGEEDDVQDKIRSLQTALDNSYKEIAELHKANAAQDSKASEIALSLEMQVREEAKQTMNKEFLKARQEKEGLIMQIEDLRISMSRLEKEHSRKEDMLRQEIADLQFQMQADEERNQELSQNVSSTTRPLLRQIENLQASYKSQAASFEKVEKNLTDRLTDTQNQLAIAVEKERTATEKLIDITSKITSLETQNSRLKQEKSHLTVQSGMDKAKIELLEEAKQNETAHIEAIKNQAAKEITELKRDKVFLESQIEMEKNKLESEKRKLALAEEQIKILERERPKSRGTPSPISVSRQESIASFTDQPPSFLSLPQEDLLERSLILSPPNNSNKISLYEQLRHSGATALIEGLQSQLKLREGEIVQLQSEITQLERTRESMAKELVNLTNHNEELQDQLKEYPELLTNFKELDGRYNAILQMYGEKVEETEELRLDLEDVKEMYKQQINHLLTK